MFTDLETQEAVWRNFCLDNAVTRIDLIYGISDFLNVSFSRSSYRKVYELSFKYKLLSQSNKSPITVLFFNSIIYNSSYEVIYPVWRAITGIIMQIKF